MHVSLPDWSSFDPNIAKHLAELAQKNLMSVGITPFGRIIPPLLVENASIYCARDSSDLDMLRQQLTVFCLEDKYPDIAQKTQGTGYLVGNYMFQAFVKSLRRQPTLLFNNVSDDIREKLEKLGLPWAGNAPETAAQFATKESFRDFLTKKELPHPRQKIISAEDLQTIPYAQLQESVGTAFVIQRAEKEVGGNDGTFFIESESAFAEAREHFAAESYEGGVLLSEYIRGDSLSMLGCATSHGTLTGPLQLQFIDVPEALHGNPPRGIFFGNDWGYASWADTEAALAQQIVEAVGAQLYAGGYRGIFGVDFVLDKSSGELYALECNPRYTGALPIYSLISLEQELPPIDLFHLLSLFSLDESFDFEAVNTALKQTTSVAHISPSPKGIEQMTGHFPAGVYAYDAAARELSYRRSGFLLSDIHDPESEFLLIDTVPRHGAPVSQGVPGFFKFVFKRSIAKSSYELDETAGMLVRKFSRFLLEKQKPSA